jgi:putative DNA primase/helicase
MSNELDVNVAKLDLKSFPNQSPSGGSTIPTTIPNVEHLLNSYGITARYNVITKKIEINIPEWEGTVDNADNTVMSHIISLVSSYGMPFGNVPEFVSAIADRNPVNPVTDWIMSKPWDGVDRLTAFYDTLITKDDFPAALKRILIYRWLISAVAAVLMSSGFHCRGVLTLQGEQSMGKTSWVKSLITDAVLREKVIKIDHHLDAGDKDTKLTAVEHWVVEVGELDSSFKKDVARLKGFLTSGTDKIRRPYARTNSEYPRRTVFIATVNDANFLVDPTGNTRWWAIPVVDVNYDHGIDMQQVFAQIHDAYVDGEQWWLTKDEEKCLESFNNRNHRSVSAIRERVLVNIDLSLEETKAMTPTELLLEIGVNNPTNAQAKECAGVLRELLGDSKRINGYNKWDVPVKTHSFF